jgi:hypothetical protein
MKATIVSTKYRGPEAVAVLARLRPADRLRLVREPENAHDPNAVAVYSGTTGRGTPERAAPSEGLPEAGLTHIGYIPRGVNRDVADRIMSADSVAAIVTAEAIVERGEVRFAPRIEIRDHFDDLLSRADD